MSIFTLLTAIAKKRMEPRPIPPQRTRVPLQLSQGSAVEINIVPMILAEHAGSLVHDDLAARHTIAAVGQYSMLGLTYSRAYLSQHTGAYLHFAARDDKILETRIYQPYSEVIPATAEEWAFWLADADGYIGYPVMQSKDEDGPQQYWRSWSAGDARISPMTPTECIVDITGAITVVRHQMMHYSRSLDETVAEHMLVSSVQTDDGMSVAFWLGIDVNIPDLTVYPSLDAPK